MENIIHIENLIYEYPQKEEKEVLRAIRGISLDIERGSFTAIIGRKRFGKIHSCKAFERFVCSDGRHYLC